MCGIVGMVGGRDVTPVLMEGLRRLEYRGYDSAGLAVINGGGLQRLRQLGKVQALQDALNGTPLSGASGIAHTRWATHGKPSEINAHPHVSGGIAVVHNGIIENHEALREQLEAHGYRFVSETDTEVIVHRIHYHLDRIGDLRLAVSRTIGELEGGYASMVVLSDAQPDALIAARIGTPVVVGLGGDGNLVASDVACAPAGDLAASIPRRRGCRRGRARLGTSFRCRRAGGSAPGPCQRADRRFGRSGAPPPLHGEGNP